MQESEPSSRVISLADVSIEIESTGVIESDLYKGQVVYRARIPGAVAAVMTNPDIDIRVTRGPEDTNNDAIPTYLDMEFDGVSVRLLPEKVKLVSFEKPDERLVEICKRITKLEKRISDFERHGEIEEERIMTIINELPAKIKSMEKTMIALERQIRIGRNLLGDAIRTHSNYWVWLEGVEHKTFNRIKKQGPGLLTIEEIEGGCSGHEVDIKSVGNNIYIMKYAKPIKARSIHDPYSQLLDVWLETDDADN